MSIPYIGFGNDTLAKLPALKTGDEIVCPTCKGKHAIEGDSFFLSYRCGDKTFMAGINGRNTMGVPADVSGEIPKDA